MRHSIVLPLFILALASLIPHSQASETENKTAVVRKFVDAFNAHDAAAMAAMVADDVRWLSIGDRSASLELEGKEALTAAMEEYFYSCSSCRSEIYGMTASNERVSVVEVASWDSNDGPKSQQSIAVYEFADSLIQGVYYFPAESVSPADPNQPDGDRNHEGIIDVHQ